MEGEPRKPVVLAADDDENAHLLLQHAFRKLGVSATLKLVSDGGQAIHYISGMGEYGDRSQYPLPDLLLLDLKMPKVSGFGVLEHLRKNPPPHKVRVIVFSSSDAQTDIKTASELGCEAYILKPTSFEKLLEVVKGLQRQYLNSSGTPAPSIQEVTSAHSFDVLQKDGTQPKQQSPISSPAMKQAEPNSPEIFRLLVEQVKDYAIFLLNKDGYILSWNEGARRINGYEPHEIIGQHFSIFYPARDRENEKPLHELRIAREMGRYEEEGWRIRKDGSRFWANVVVTPLHDKDGKVAGFAKVTRDLTQRKLQEENIQKLLESEERFRLLVDQVRDYAIFILDVRGMIGTWNQGARRLKGYTAEEILGKHFSVFYTPEDLARDHPAKELSIAIRDGRYEEEGWRVRKDGSRFWANVVITSLWDKRGNLTGFAKVTRDLTQRKIQEDALRRKSEELEAFAHTLSHDLRSPLRTISSFAQILTHEVAKKLSTEEQSYLEKIVGAANSMETLISDILKLSQISVVDIHASIVDLNEVIAEALRMAESEIQRLGIEPKIEQPLPKVFGNQTLLLQIFSNLINNSIKFSRPGGRPNLEIFATVKNDACEIHVKDNGIGISPEYHESIFHPFNRGGAERGISGNGIGLSVVKKAVERLGGVIAVKSKVGEGSEFIVRLNCAQNGVAQPAESNP